MSHIIFVPPAATHLGPPVISHAHQSAAKWREGTKLAQISRKSKGKRNKTPVGTKFSFALNEPATVSFVFSQKVGGRKVGGHCVARTRRNRPRKGCVRVVVAGALSFSGHAGANTVVFQGRISRLKTLKPGVYAVAIRATAAGVRSAPVSLRFTIVR